VTAPKEDQHQGRSSAAVRHLPWIAAAAFALPALWAARDYGLVFDSHRWFPIGDDILRYLTGQRPWAPELYVPGFENYGTLAAIGSAVTSAILHDWLGVVNGLLGHQLFIVLCGAAIVGLTARLAIDLSGPRLAVLAAALIAVSPRFFAEAQNNISDVPAAVAWLAAISCVVRALGEDRVAPLFGAATAIGAIGAVRVPNLPFLPAVLIVWLVLDREARRHACRLLRRSRWWQLAAIAITAPLFLWLFRPLAWTAPRVYFWTVYDGMFVPGRGNVPVFFRGRQFWSGGPPSYHAVMLAVTTPLPQLVAGLIGAVVVWRRQRSAAWLLVAWLTVSVGRYAAMGLGNYGGVRHVLDAFPALALLEAFGVLAVLDALARKGSKRAWTLQAAALLVVIVPGAAAIWRLHPYPMTYYNALVGGLHGASRRFETEYAGAAYREAIEWAAQHFGEGDTLWITHGPLEGRLVQVEAAYLGLSQVPVQDGTPFQVAAWQLGQSRASAGSRRAGRKSARVFAVQNFRGSPVERLPPGLPAALLPLVYEVRREGVPLLRIREVPPELLREVVTGLAAHGGRKRKSANQP
jgi:hypothetical protein